MEKPSELHCPRYASFAPREPHTAEAAIVIEDAYQGRGLGTQLLERLLRYALSQGIKVFQATIHYSNDPIMRFVRRSGLRFETKSEWGVQEVNVYLDQASDTPSL